MSIEINDMGISVVEDESLFDLIASNAETALQEINEPAAEEHRIAPWAQNCRPGVTGDLFKKVTIKQKSAKQRGEEEARNYQRRRELKQYKEDRESENARIEDRSETVRGGELWPEEVRTEEERP